MLQSTRRAPDAEGTPFAANTVTPTANFFARAFSTASRRNVLVGARLRQQTRFALSAGDAATTPFVSVASRYRVLPRVESRGRTSYVGTERPSMLSSFLDARALRIKSPRSRQYLLRTTETTSVEQLAVLGTYRSARSRFAYYTEHSSVTRNTRRFSRPTSAPSTCAQPDLLTPRKSFQTRGTVDLLTAEQARRAQKSALAKQLCFTSRRAVHPRG
jgi:hypothetical protein